MSAPVSREVAALLAAQAARVEDLRALTADRPAHAAYLAALLEAGTFEACARVNAPRGVSRQVEEALFCDAVWCLAAPPAPGRHVSGYPGEYAALRLRQRRAAAARQARSSALHALLRLDVAGGSR